MKETKYEEIAELLADPKGLAMAIDIVYAAFKSSIYRFSIEGSGCLQR